MLKMRINSSFSCIMIVFLTLCAVLSVCSALSRNISNRVGKAFYIYIKELKQGDPPYFFVACVCVCVLLYS